MTHETFMAETLPEFLASESFRRGHAVSDDYKAAWSQSVVVRMRGGCGSTGHSTFPDSELLWTTCWRPDGMCEGGHGEEQGQYKHAVEIYRTKMMERRGLGLM